jgi:feruloyl esterase
MGPPPVKVLPPRSRPVYPYPLVAAYAGHGSIDDAASFVPARR